MRRLAVWVSLGKVTSRGTVTLISPTRTIKAPIEVRRVDGVEIGQRKFRIDHCNIV